MTCSDSLIISGAIAVLLAFFAGKSFLKIDFSFVLPRNRKKLKIKRMLKDDEISLQGIKIHGEIKKAFNEILLPLYIVDKKLLPKRTDKTFRKRFENQIDLLERRGLRYEVRLTDVEVIPKNDFIRWNDDGREWREAVLKCSALERLVSLQNEEEKYCFYRKNAFLRILQSRHILHSDKEDKTKHLYKIGLIITCPSCGGDIVLHSQQVICGYCGGLIQNDFYDWQTEEFEIYEKLGTNTKNFFMLFIVTAILFCSEFLCLRFISNIEISLSIGLLAAICIFVAFIVPVVQAEKKQEKLANKISQSTKMVPVSSINDTVRCASVRAAHPAYMCQTFERRAAKVLPNEERSNISVRQWC